MRRAFGLAVLISLVAGGCLLEIDRGKIAAAPVDAASALDGASPEASLDGGTSLVGSWSFDDAVGTVAADGTGHGHTATLSGAARFDDAGARGGSVSFSGGYVSIPDLNGSSFPRSFTFSVWFKYTFAVDDPEQRSVLDVWEMNRPHLLVRRGSGAAAKAFQVAGQVEDGTFAFSMTFDVEQATWTHVVVTWDEPTRSGVIYLNDMPIRRLMLTSPFAPDGQLFRLGTNFVGGIDEVRLYDRALTATEVIEIR